ncbi:hypothetical protein L6452_44735 [Arctium lappa]|nr:hypothetical protein L6452_44735 [Arctium lappa]
MNASKAKKVTKAEKPAKVDPKKKVDSSKGEEPNDELKVEGRGAGRKISEKDTSGNQGLRDNVEPITGEKGDTTKVSLTKPLSDVVGVVEPSRQAEVMGVENLHGINDGKGGSLDKVGDEGKTPAAVNRLVLPLVLKAFSKPRRGTTHFVHDNRFSSLMDDADSKIKNGGEESSDSFILDLLENIMVDPLVPGGGRY